MKKIIYIIVFISYITLQVKFCNAQWIYQSLPSYHDVQDIKFFDESTGILISYYNDPGIYRTTNGGNNWAMINSNISCYNMQKIDSTALYLVGRYSGIDRIQRTFDRGLTWDSVSLTLNGGYTGISFLNRDTGWVTGANYLNYNCIWKTTDGGATLTELTDTTGMGLIFFLKTKINGEYYGWLFGKYGDNKFWRTTNSGTNWFQTTRPSQYCNYFEFIDGNTGWFTGSSNIYKTTNGGSNWIMQTVPFGNGIYNSITNFYIINYDTVFGGGGYKTFPNNRNYEIIWKTINGGINWGYLLPDTSFNLGGAGAIYFLNSLTGWVYGGGNGAYTTNGGGTIIYTDIKNSNEIILKEFILYQNYPNPFNPSTNIKYQISRHGGSSTNNKYITIKIYNLLGKEITTLVNEKQKAGEYEVSFNALSLSSGIYYYALYADGVRMDAKKMLMLK